MVNGAFPTALRRPPERQDTLVLPRSSSEDSHARMGSEDDGGGELALPAAEPTMRPRIYPRIFLRYSSAGK